MSKLLTYGLAFILALFATLFLFAFLVSGWDLNKTITILSGYFTSILGTVTDALQGVLGNFVSMFQQDPATALSYVAAGAAPVATVGYTAYKWLSDRKKQELNQMLEQRMTERSETLNFEADQKNQINILEQRVKDLQSQLEGGVDVSEIQQRLTEAKGEVDRYRLQVDNLHEVIKNLKAETIIEKTIVK